MLNTKYSPWPNFSETECAIVAEVLRSNKVNYWTGNKGKEFEQKFSQWVGSEYAIGLANGTLALEIALRALGVSVGDEVIIPPRTFMATASAVSIIGAIPIFADIDPFSQNISAGEIAKKITSKTKAVICVHLAGWPCDMDEIIAVCQPHNIKIVEDCAQAHGAQYRGKPVGSFGHIAAWSFCQDKIITTGGEGGMVTTNDLDLYKWMWEFKDHGKSYNSVYNKKHPPGFRWLHDSIGSNYRLTEMQSALGIYQLDQVDDWVDRRREIAAAYRAVIEKYDFIEGHKPDNDIKHAYYRYYAFWEHPKVTRDQFIELCTAKELPIFQGSCSEVYREKAFLNTVSLPKRPLKNAVKVGLESLMFLTHPSLTNDEVQDMCNKLESILKKVRKDK